jgi:hypothetical protein
MLSRSKKTELDYLNSIVHFANLYSTLVLDAEFEAFLKKAFRENLEGLARVREEKAALNYAKRQSKMSAISKAIYSNRSGRYNVSDL